jgi:hypothetical protein
MALYLRRGTPLDFEAVTGNDRVARTPISPGRTPLPKDRPRAVAAPRREGPPTPAPQPALVDSHDVEWRG